MSREFPGGSLAGSQGVRLGCAGAASLPLLLALVLLVQGIKRYEDIVVDNPQELRRRADFLQRHAAGLLPK